jgi:hypothetical protein
MEEKSGIFTWLRNVRGWYRTDKITEVLSYCVGLRYYWPLPSCKIKEWYICLNGCICEDRCINLINTLNSLSKYSCTYSLSFTSLPFLSFPTLSFPLSPSLPFPSILSFLLSPFYFPLLSFPFLSFPFLSFPFLSFPFLSFPLISPPPWPICFNDLYTLRKHTVKSLF